MKRALILIWLLLLASTPKDTPAEPLEKVNIAVMDLLITAGVPESYKIPLSNRLRQELLNTPSFKVIERNFMAEILTEQGLIMSECTSDACVVEMGRILNVRLMIAGSLDLIGTMHTISLRMIDVETAEILFARSIDCACPIETILTEKLSEIANTFSSLYAGEEPEPEPTQTTTIAQTPDEEVVLPEQPPAPAITTAVITDSIKSELPMYSGLGVLVGLNTSEYKMLQFKRNPSGIPIPSFKEQIIPYGSYGIRLSVPSTNRFFMNISGGYNYWKIEDKIAHVDYYNRWDYLEKTDKYVFSTSIDNYFVSIEGNILLTRHFSLLLGFGYERVRQNITVQLETSDSPYYWTGYDEGFPYENIAYEPIWNEIQEEKLGFNLGFGLRFWSRSGIEAKYCYRFPSTFKYEYDPSLISAIPEFQTFKILAYFYPLVDEIK